MNEIKTEEYTITELSEKTGLSKMMLIRLWPNLNPNIPLSIEDIKSGIPQVLWLNWGYDNPPKTLLRCVDWKMSLTINPKDNFDVNMLKLITRNVIEEVNDKVGGCEDDEHFVMYYQIDNVKGKNMIFIHFSDDVLKTSQINTIAKKVCRNLMAKAFIETKKYYPEDTWVKIRMMSPKLHGIASCGGLHSSSNLY
jgi:hypothetical protein